MLTKPATLLACTLPLLLVPCLFGQDAGEKVNVPLHDPSRPARLRAHLINGGITVKAADVKEVTIEVHGSRRTNVAPPRRHRSPEDDGKADGLKRLDLPGNSGLDVEEDNNVVTVKTSPWNAGGDLMITVPRRTSLQLKCMNSGDIEVEGVDGEIDADNLNGRVTLKNVSGSVLAHSLNGNISVTLDRIDASKPMSFSTLNGDIDVSLPTSTAANVRLKTDNGEIYSDFEVKMNASSNTPEREAGRQPDGRYRVRFDRSLRGSINGGGPEYQFTSFNGRIFIRRKK